jgi:site-specific DNA-methyltransferase (adenine-specific)
MNHGGEYLRREYEYLRREYEDLRREYEDLRRPFHVSADVPYTDVWDFPTVAHYPGKHPCEKPPELLEHIIGASSKPGAVVLDCFMGTGNTGLAALKLGRNFIGIDIDAKYYRRAEQRITAAQMQTVMELPA